MSIKYSFVFIFFFIVMECKGQFLSYKHGQYSFIRRVEDSIFYNPNQIKRLKIKEIRVKNTVFPRFTFKSFKKFNINGNIYKEKPHRKRILPWIPLIKIYKKEKSILLNADSIKKDSLGRLVSIKYESVVENYFYDSHNNLVKIQILRPFEYAYVETSSVNEIDLRYDSLNNLIEEKIVSDSIDSVIVKHFYQNKVITNTKKYYYETSNNFRSYHAKFIDGSNEEVYNYIYLDNGLLNRIVLLDSSAKKRRQLVFKYRYYK